MKKIDMIVGVVLFFVVLFLSGCQEQTANDTSENKFDKKFIGDWLNNDSSAYNEIWTFYSNSTVKIIVSWAVEEEPIITTFWFHYEVNIDTLCLSSIDESPDSPSYYLECHGFSFSDDANHLSLNINGTDFMEFTRIS